LQYNGKPVKASRLFAGHEHDEQAKRIAAHFQLDPAFYRSIHFNDELITALQKKNGQQTVSLQECVFRKRDLTQFNSAEEAYHQLMLDIVAQQTLSAQLVLDGRQTKRIFVDGGFSRNEIYMNLLAAAFPSMEVYATSMAQASALGAALAIHEAWNERHIPSDIIELKYYSAIHSTSL
jgi:sugar (pentulose or hexulose) kinase